MPKAPTIPAEQAIPALADALAYYDESDVQRWFDRNLRMTGHYPAVYTATIEDVRAFRMVPNEPFRKAWLSLTRPMILGEPISVKGSHGAGYEGGPMGGEPEWAGRLREEIIRVRSTPRGLDFPNGKVGPKNLTSAGLGDFMRSCLGIKESAGTRISVAWLLQYEVADAICRALGLVPIQVGI